MWSGASNPWSGGGSRLAESVVGRQLLSGEGGKSGRTSCDCGFTSPDGRPCGDSNTGVTSGGSPWSFNEGTGLCESAVTCSRPCSNCYAAGGSRDLLDPEGAWGGRGDWGQAELRKVCRRVGAYDNADCLKVKCVHSEGGCLCYVQCCNTKDSGEGCALCEMVLIDGGAFPTCPAEEIDSAPGVVSESPCWSKSLADAIEAAKENWAEIQADLERAQAVYDALAEETSEWVNSWGIDWGEDSEGTGGVLGTARPGTCAEVHPETSECSEEYVEFTSAKAAIEWEVKERELRREDYKIEIGKATACPGSHHNIKPAKGKGILFSVICCDCCSESGGFAQVSASACRITYP